MHGEWRINKGFDIVTQLSIGEREPNPDGECCLALQEHVAIALQIYFQAHGIGLGVVEGWIDKTRVE